MQPRWEPGAIPAGGLGARLLSIGGLFALAVVLEVGGKAPYSDRTLTALYALVLAGFLSTLGFAFLAGSGRARLLGVIEPLADWVLITGLVYCTGGSRSVFGFLYLVWIVYAASRAGSAGAGLAPVAATFGYGGVAVGIAGGWLQALDPGDVPSVKEALSALGTHSLAFALVALLAHRLAQQVKRGRDELHELGEIHRRIFDNVSSGLLAVDVSGRITSFNPEAARITGYSSDEVRGWPLERLFPSIDELPRDGEDRAGAMDRAAPTSEGRLSRSQLAFCNREGARLHLGLSRSILRDANGSPEGSVLIFQDLTRVVEMEDELRRSERLAAVGQLAAGLAHEIRNPLASLSGSIQLLEREFPALSPDSRRLVRIVNRETARLNRLVSEFLSYARPGPGRHDRVVLSELLDDLSALVAGGPESRAQLVVDVPEDLAITGDPDQMRQVLWNLVLNGIEAEPEDDTVRVRARSLPPEEGRPEAVVSIEVSDRGVGISPDVMKRLFEPFFTTKPTGTGLGLATVHRVVEAHGGSLHVRSEASQGTCVSVLLPEAKP
jgi:two-component system sensor histidine kinase PilS (NtrC family)